MASHSDSRDSVVDQFSVAWSAVGESGEPPRLSDVISDAAPDWAQEGLLVDLLRIDLRERAQRSLSLGLEQYIERLPRFEGLLRSKHPELLEAALAEGDGEGDGSEYDTIAAPSYVPIRPPSPDDTPRDFAPVGSRMPECIGAYRVEKLLGSGAFSDVYLAHHAELGQQFAIKVLKNELEGREDLWGSLQHEAKQLVTLRHPAIVRFFHLDRHEGRPYMVVEYVEGGSLADLISDKRLSIVESVDLVREVAEGLHSAHELGIIHRDLKPANILIDKNGRPRIADFGLAMDYTDFGSGPHMAGTYRYMSPEQARSEAHRVDGRSDLFSLGAIFYELLTGLKAFKGNSIGQLLDWIVNNPPQPLRQANAQAPEELERICLRCLEKRASDRYTCGMDLVADLDAWRRTQSASYEVLPAEAPPKVVPKGLRSFDSNDADFFISLLPGPRDRHGDPEAIRFWKVWAEQPGDIDTAVGVVYGPSGCGKSSLIRAGLLPRLAPHVDTLEINAEGAQTAAVLDRRLRQRYPELAPGESLSSLLLRLRESLPQRGRKLLIVIDQFEQHLHGGSNEERAQLADALRQCDGVGLSALLVTREDFWLSLKRFMNRIEAPIRDGRNSLLVDLFDDAHARGVLLQLGRALGKLPEGDLSDEHNQFLDDAMRFLAPEGIVSPVQLAVFVELMKRRNWTPRTLHELDSIKALGVAFLEEVFDRAAPARTRALATAAQRVLSELLPTGANELKGSARTREELRQAAAEVDRAVDFDELLNLLVNRYRLLSPADIDPEERGGGDESQQKGRSYQLTHDYLVPSIREWLRRKKGRAELLLSRRADEWGVDREARNLPSLLETIAISLRTRRSAWTPVEREMMASAGRRHSLRVGAVALAAAGLAWAVLGYRQAITQRSLINELLSAEPAKVAPLVERVRSGGDSALRGLRRLEPDALNPQEAIKVAAALAGEPASDQTLNAWLLADSAVAAASNPDYFKLALDALVGAEALDADALATAAADPERALDVRFRAAAALLASGHADGADTAALAADGLMELDHTTRKQWLETLPADFRQAVRDELLSRLQAKTDSDRVRGERVFDTLRQDFLDEGDPQTTRALVEWADISQIGRVLPLPPAPAVSKSLALRLEELRERDLTESDLDERVEHVKRTANTAAALITADPSADIWPLLSTEPGENPEVAYRLVIALGENAVATEAVLDRLERADDQDPASLVARLLLIAGLADRSELRPASDARRAELARRFFADHPDAAVHSAASWALAGSGTRPGPIKPCHGARWRYSPGGALMVEFSPQTSWVGSPPEEPRRDKDGWLRPGAETPTEIEARRRVRTDRFLIAATEETVERYKSKMVDYEPIENISMNDRYPAHLVKWANVGAYCNLLSEEEGLEPAFDPKTQSYDTSKNGYRLPTADEWEVAARAGAPTSRCYGEDHALLDRFAWYAGNSMSERYNPVGELMPNQAGLFDTLGNISELCCDGPLKLYPAVDEGGLHDEPYPGEFRVHRGSAYNDAAPNIRLALVWGTEVKETDERELGSVGFRLARTLTENENSPDTPAAGADAPGP